MAEPRQLLSLIRQQFPGRAPGADYVTEVVPNMCRIRHFGRRRFLVPTAGRVWLRSSIDTAYLHD